MKKKVGPLFKSIYDPSTLAILKDDVVSDIFYHAERIAKEMLDHYQAYNPREIVELVAERFSVEAARRILKARK